MSHLPDTILGFYQETPHPEADTLWAAMPTEVRRALRRAYRQDGAVRLLNKIGDHLREGQWSLWPYPPALRQSLDLELRARLVQRLRDDHV